MDKRPHIGYCHLIGAKGSSSKETEEMNTMSREQINYNYYCGLPQSFNVHKVVINYASGLSSLDEYTQFYNSFTAIQKHIADVMITQIADETNCALAAQKLSSK
jgi:hypothetical protein